MKHPYSTTHYHCGCHIIEDRPNRVNLTESIYCDDKPDERYIECLYTKVLRMFRVRASRRTC